MTKATSLEAPRAPREDLVHVSTIKSCHNVEDMRLLAKQRLPGPIFHYIDGAADDEVTYRRNTNAFEECDLVPNVLAGVENVDMSVTVMGRQMAMPFML